MTEESFDRLLRKALMEAVWQDFRPAIEAAEHEQITYSERYLKRRERLIEDPFGYAKKMLRTPLQRVARTVAMILLVCSILFAMAMSIPEVRAAIKRLYMEWYETHIAVYVQEPSGGDITDLSAFRVEIPEAVLPEGYRETVRLEMIGNIRYSKEGSKDIMIDYCRVKEADLVGINGESMVEYCEVIDGVEYHFFENVNERGTTQIMWVEEEYGLMITIIAPHTMSTEELTFVACNVLVEKIKPE